MIGREAAELKPDVVTPNSLLSVCPIESANLSRSSSPEMTFAGARIMAFSLRPNGSAVTITESSFFMVSSA